MARVDSNPQERPECLYSSWLLRPARADESISEPEFAPHRLELRIVISLVLGEVSGYPCAKRVYTINRTQSAEVWAGPSDAIHNPQQRVQQPNQLGIAGYRKRSGKLCTQGIMGVMLHRCGHG
jgi:hypothetical protein